MWVVLILLQTVSQHGMLTQAEGCTSDFCFDEDLPPLTHTLNNSMSESHLKKMGKFTITEGSLAADPIAEKYETFFSPGKSESKTKFEVNKPEEEGMAGSLLLFDEESEPIHQTKLSCEDAFLSPKLKMLHSPDSRSTSSPDSSSPVLTLASSFKDSSSISRGFIIPDDPEPPQ